MGILKGIIDRFRAMGKTEKEISEFEVVSFAIRAKQE